MKVPMKAIKSEEFIVACIFFLGFLSLALHTLGWPSKPRAVPLSVSLIALALLAGEMVNIIREKGAKAVKPISWKVIAGFLSLGTAILLGFVIGLAPMVGILGAALTSIYGERRWWVIILVGLVSFSVMYFIFGMILKMPMNY